MFIAITSGRLADDVGIAVLLEFQRQLLVAGLDDLALVEDVHGVGHDVVEQALVMGDDEDRRGRANAAR